MSLVTRCLRLPLNNHLLLFGARNTGKSTLLKQTFPQKNTFWIDLLNPNEEENYLRQPELLSQQVQALEPHITHVVIDEIQKVPKLLDVVHQLIEISQKYFIMTGSSTRKLRHGGANLLAGRADIYYLFPFSAFELGDEFLLDDALRWGTLPSIYTKPTVEQKNNFLRSYAQTYLREEIWLEQFIRKLDPFRQFLEVSAQCNGKIINVANIARDVGVDNKTVKEYFCLLEDTLVGFFLAPFQHSFRKRLSQKPKFYYFDPGIVRSLARNLSVPLTLSTSAYGEAFEHFLITEAIRLAHYYYPDYRFTYLKTKEGLEVDLLVERPGKKILFIEIKSTEKVDEMQLRTLQRLVSDFGDCEAICFSREPHAKKIHDVTVYPWYMGLKKYFHREY